MENQLAEKLGIRTPVRGTAYAGAGKSGRAGAQKGRAGAGYDRKGYRKYSGNQKRAGRNFTASLWHEKMTKECLQQLKNIVDFERAVMENDVERFVDIDEDLHDVIFQATENDKLIQMFRNLRIQLYRYRMAQAKNDNSMSTIVAQLPEVFCVRWKIMTARKAQQAQGHIKYQTESILRFIKNK